MINRFRIGIVKIPNIYISTSMYIVVTCVRFEFQIFNPKLSIYMYILLQIISLEHWKIYIIILLLIII